MTKEEVGRVFETMLSIPGMNEQVKVDLKISRKLVLVLAQVIERGLSQEKQDPSGLIRAAGTEAAAELSTIAQDCLQKAGMTELNGKLLQLQS
jgi:hypothetical protein